MSSSIGSITNLQGLGLSRYFTRHMLGVNGCSSVDNHLDNVDTPKFKYLAASVSVLKSYSCVVKIFFTEIGFSISVR